MSVLIVATLLSSAPPSEADFRLAYDNLPAHALVTCKVCEEGKAAQFKFTSYKSLLVMSYEHLRRTKAYAELSRKRSALLYGPLPVLATTHQ